MVIARVGVPAGTSQETLALMAAIAMPTKRLYVGSFVEVVIRVSLSSRREEDTFVSFRRARLV
jgi:hypothetical protein